MFSFTFSACLYISNPATVPFPEVGLLRPHSILIAVVFPAPLAPKKPKISPLKTLKEMWFTAVKFPKVLVRFSVSITISFISSVFKQAACNNLL